MILYGSQYCVVVERTVPNGLEFGILYGRGKILQCSRAQVVAAQKNLATDTPERAGKE